jgi:hypothetical protein
MEIFHLFGQETWAWITWGNSQLQHVAYYATMVTFLGVAWQLFTAWRQTWLVRIFVVNADSATEERTEVGLLPRRHVTRAEINGLVSQAAGGARLDFSCFRFDYKVRSSIDVALPEASYLLVIRSRSPDRPQESNPLASPNDLPVDASQS